MKLLCLIIKDIEKPDLADVISYALKISRSEAKRLIIQGAVTVGEKCTDPFGAKIIDLDDIQNTLI